MVVNVPLLIVWFIWCLVSGMASYDRDNVWKLPAAMLFNAVCYVCIISPIVFK